MESLIIFLFIFLSLLYIHIISKTDSGKISQDIISVIKNLNENNTIVWILVLSVFLIFIYIISCQCTKIIKDNFAFNVTPERKCCSGVYKDEKQLKKCSNMKLDKHCCKQRGLYNGKPVNFEYTPDTNDYWETKF